MGSIPLPALSLRPPQQQSDPVERYARLSQLKSMIQEQPLRQQALQQQLQAGAAENQQRQIQLQQAQQGQQDQQAISAALKDPSLQGKTYSDIADHLAKNGAASPQAIMQLKTADLKARTDLAGYDEKRLAVLKAGNDALSKINSSVMAMPDEEVAQNWVNIAQAVNSIPGSDFRLDPNKPMTKDQLSHAGPLIGLHAAYLDEANEKLKKKADLAEAEAKAKLTAQQAEIGGTSDQARVIHDYLKSNGLQDTPENRTKAFDWYNKQTKIAPAEVRAQVLLQTPTQVYDPATGQTTYVARKDAIGQVAPSSAEAQAEKGTAKYFTSGKGGQQITAFNTAVDHLNLLEKLSNDLGNGNLQVFNKAAQSWAQQTGNPAPTNFEAAKNAMSGEVAAALKASGATDKEIEKVDQTFSRAQSPIQLKGAIVTYRMLLNSKRNNLQKQYEQGMQGKPNLGEASQDYPSSDPFAQFGGKAH